jgi:hypothetical protein
MIEVPCLCGEKFKLTDDMAGEMFQCMKCSRLVAVPTLDDLQHLGTDGTYDVGDVVAPPRRGDQTPIMGTEEANSTVANTDQSIPCEFEEPVRVAPRYDPFTGELVREHEVVVTEDSEEAKKPKRTQPITKMKDRGMVTPPPRYAWLQLFGEMFMSHNIAVLGLMFGVNVFLALISSFVIGIGFFFAYGVPLLVACISAGYYAIIVQEMGPGDRDNLPTPLRDFDLRTDVWDPLVYAAVTLAICLGPGLYVEKFASEYPSAEWISNGLLLLGAYFVPVVFLTATSGGVIANFRPDRILRVIQLAGFDYIVVVIAWCAGMILLLDGLYGIYVAAYNAFQWIGQAAQLPRFVGGWGVSFAVIFGGLYLTYYAMWLLGFIWRKHYLEFPWIGQRTEPRKVAPPPVRPPLPPTKATSTERGPMVG